MKTAGMSLSRCTWCADLFTSTVVCGSGPSDASQSEVETDADVRDIVLEELSIRRGALVELHHQRHEPRRMPFCARCGPSPVRVVRSSPVTSREGPWFSRPGRPPVGTDPHVHCEARRLRETAPTAECRARVGRFAPRRHTPVADPLPATREARPTRTKDSRGRSHHFEEGTRRRDGSSDGRAGARVLKPLRRKVRGRPMR